VVDPVTNGALIVGSAGAGTWLADKVFGPSAEALGEALRVYLGDRVSKVFSRAETLADDPETLQQLPPGFLFKFIQSASFSEDDEIITEMWANLLLSSSRGFQQRHVLYLDILDKLAAEDAKILDDLISPLLNPIQSHSVQMLLEYVRIRGLTSAEHILSERGLTHFDGVAANQFNDEMWTLKHHWPSRILGSLVPYTPLMVEGHGSATSSSSGLANSNAPYDALIRQRLVQTFEVSFICGFQIELEGVMATALGVEFIRNCRGIANEPNPS
jgi:hypothetical protein